MKRLNLFFLAALVWQMSIPEISGAQPVGSPGKAASEHTTWVGVSGGVALFVNDIDGAHEVLQNAMTPSGIFEASFRRKLWDKYFWEVSAVTTQFSSGQRYAFENGFTGGTPHTNAFPAAHAFSGLGYRLKLDNGVSIADLQAGVGGGMNRDYQGGYRGGGNTRIEYPETGSFYQDSTSDYERHRFYPLVYAAIGRDFRVAGNFYLTLQYRYQQGFLSIHESRIAYTSSENMDMRYASSVLRGSGHSAALGCRYGFGKSGS